MSIINIAFIITSTINPISSDLTYGVRSYYSINERFKQTLQTIHSIKKYVPEADIILIEGSKITYEMEFILDSLVHSYLNTYSNKIIRKGIESKLKGYGETLQIKYIFDNLNMMKYDFIFKISGRYHLNNEFNLINLTKQKEITFCKGKSTNPPIVSTVLYLIPKQQINTIIYTYNIVSKLYQEYNKRILRGSKIYLHYENIIPEIIQKFNIIEKIGVEGLVSSYKSFYKC